MFCRSILTVLSLMTVFAAPVRAQTAPFYEGFDNAFENTWNTFPFASVDLGDFPFVIFQGFPVGGFQSVDGDLVFRMSNTFGTSITYVGMSPQTVFYDDLGVVEARIRTYDIDTVNTQSPIAIRLVSPGGPKITVGIFGTTRFWVGSTIDDTLEASVGFNMQENTWYRLRFIQKQGVLRAQIHTDSGQLISSHDFGHTLADMTTIGGGAALYLEVVQTMYALANDANPSTLNAGIDWIEVRLPCPADLNDDGGLSFPDVSLFLALFNAGDLGADFTGDGAVTFADVSAFIAAFTAGCP